jgi:replicative DNA helicase
MALTNRTSQAKGPEEPPKQTARDTWQELLYAAGEDLASQRDPEMEELLIGAMIIDPEQIDTISVNLRGGDFFDKELGNIFDYLCVRRELKEPVDDLRLVVAALKKYKIIGKGKVKIADIGKWVAKATTTSARWYASEILKHSQARMQLNAVTRSMIALMDGAVEPKESAASLVAKLDSIYMRSEIGLTNIGTAGELAVKEIEEAAKAEKVMGISTSLLTMDEMIGGLFPGEVTVLAARPSAGKTALAMQMCDAAAMSGSPTLFVSLEMSAQELSIRTMCAKANVNNKNIRAGVVNKAEIEALRAVSEGMKSYPLVIYDPPEANMKMIRAAMKMAQAKDGLKLVCIDYLQLVRPTDRRLDRVEQIAEVTNGAKALAKEFKLPVILLCQLNREAEGEKPKLSHLKGSGSIEQDADTVIAIHRSDKKEKAELIVLKNRHGERGTIEVDWHPEATRFEDQREIF